VPLLLEKKGSPPKLSPVNRASAFPKFPLPVRVLIIATTLGVALWGTLTIIDAAGDGRLQKFERSLMLNLRQPDNPAEPRGPHWLEQTAIDWTSLGGIPILSLLIVLSISYLLLVRRPRAAAFVLGATSGGIALSFYLKTVANRARPDFLEHLANVATSSFPSAHAMASAIVYLTLGTLLARSAQSRREKRFFLWTAYFLTLAVGLTRVYLGVHYPTDVIAGWVVGILWAMICLTVMVRLEKRRALRSVGKNERSTEPNTRSEVNAHHPIH